MRFVKIDGHSPPKYKDAASISSSPQYHYLRTEPSEVGGSNASGMNYVPLATTSKNLGALANHGELLVESTEGLIPQSGYMPPEYEVDFVQDDLTEDDRRLAAALVAVQLVNQQKQQSG